MAKEKNVGNTGINKAQSLMDKLLKTSKIEGAERLVDSTILNEKPPAQTRVKLINVALSGRVDGGLSCGCFLICGPSRHYKSSYGLIAVKGFLDANPDGICLYYNNEFGIKKAYFENSGIDMSRVMHLPFENLEKLKFDLVAKLEELTIDDKVVIICDSLGNSSSRKELMDALEEKSSADFTRAKTIKSIMRMITPLLYMKDIPFIGIAHTYVDMNSYGGTKQIVGGGTGMYYNPDTIWIVGKSQVKEGEEKVGSTFTINIEKSRYVKENAKIPIVVRWDSGIANYSGLAELAKDFGIVSEGRRGKSFTLQYTKLDGTVIDTLLKRNDEDEVFWETVLKETDLAYRIETYYSIPTPKSVSEITKELDEDDDDLED